MTRGAVHCWLVVVVLGALAACSEEERAPFYRTRVPDEQVDGSVGAPRGVQLGGGSRPGSNPGSTPGSSEDDDDPRYFVWISDLSGSAPLSSSGTAGIDINAVSLSVGGEIFYADHVYECEFGLGEVGGHADDCDQALGPPDDGECSTEFPNAVSLGGDGGSLVIGFEGLPEITPGSLITVYECFGSETYSAFVGPESSSLDSGWRTCLFQTWGTSSCWAP